MSDTNIQEVASEAPLKPDAVQSAQPGDAHGKRPNDKSEGKDAPEKLTPDSCQTSEPGNAHANRPADKFVGEGVEAFKTAIAEIAPFKADIAESMKDLLTAQGITEEFAGQAIEVFEAAVNEVASQYTNSLAEAAQTVFLSTITAQLDEMQTTVDATVAEAVTEWIAENQIALDESVKAANHNTLVAEMVKLLSAAGYTVAEGVAPTVEGAPVAEETTAEVAVSEETTTQIDTLSEEVTNLRKQLAINTFTRGLSDLQAERIVALSEGLTYADDESFTAKLKVLSENFAGVKAAKLADEGLDPITEEVVQESASAVDPYVAAMSSVMGKYKRD